ncbi:hypothetical protein AN189_11670 [Loktanella sp. 3ANDIMAR09]|uniref:hypothetical protein n=1 Tax=Loktanella sp. 3ANDIMAR09 TaxID=1225657 RepID=UPI000701BE46|nr:hypothetical protein [Loktanella sp. 3ANDIMAR09]KQI68071.1 hypothetical protein AN189_11670 [Loktanella sp. 3ANDIMAR09]
MANMMADNTKMDGEQAAILRDLCEKTGHPFSDQMSASKAAALIDELSLQVDDTDLKSER